MEWVPFEEFGGFFKVENGELLHSPMNIDGTIEINEFGEYGIDEAPRSTIERLHEVLGDFSHKGIAIYEADEDGNLIDPEEGLYG